MFRTNREKICFKYWGCIRTKIAASMGLPVRDGYELIRHIYKISKEDYEKRLDEFIEMLDMKEFINQPVRQLSLGQKMRAEIVATMLHNPKIIFLDEPTIGLDLVAKKKIQDFIRTINKNIMLQSFLRLMTCRT